MPSSFALWTVHFLSEYSSVPFACIPRDRLVTLRTVQFLPFRSTILKFQDNWLPQTVHFHPYEQLSETSMNLFWYLVWNEPLSKLSSQKYSIQLDSILFCGFCSILFEWFYFLDWRISRFLFSLPSCSVASKQRDLKLSSGKWMINIPQPYQGPYLQTSKNPEQKRK